jgi:hypothetical protein
MWYIYISKYNVLSLWASPLPNAGRAKGARSWAQRKLDRAVQQKQKRAYCTITDGEATMMMARFVGGWHVDHRVCGHDVTKL